MRSRERLAIIWTNFGPYHMARIRALAPHFDVHAIELASYQRLYRWPERKPDIFVRTLRQGAWEDQNQLSVAVDLWRQLSALRPRIVLVPGYASLPALCAAAWGRIHGAEAVLMSESNIDDQQRSTLGEGVKRVLVTSLFGSAIVGGRRAASYLEFLGMPADRIARRYDVVDNEYFSRNAVQHRSSLQESSNGKRKPYFLYVGRLAPKKNVSTLLHAFTSYRKNGGVWPLVIVGDGPLRDSLRNQSEAHIRTGAIAFTGHKNVEDLPPLYAAAGCFVLPSMVEPWGLVVNEAMASGLPVIVSSHCGCVDDLVYHGSNGFIVDPTSESDLAAALSRVSSMDLAERVQMGERSQEFIAEYSLERWASEVQRIANITVKNSNCGH